ncbi:hypothetical protein [Achromobacter insolitus]|uniref:hypothetical protein n=1 Tax=Achromobacter insolitus TaxID=217204 RepID=UPI000AC496DE|nr:hypothetical protein [Achromobacter insolitus]
MLKTISRLLAPLALAAAVLPLAAIAEPSLTRIIVPVGAGNPFDSSARALAEGLAKISGKSVIVENKAGAGGASPRPKLPAPHPMAQRCCSPPLAMLPTPGCIRTCRTTPSRTSRPSPS